MVKLVGTPGQLLPPPETTGVTVIVALIGALVVFVVTNAAMFPEPDAANPMAGLLFVQLYTVPAMADPVKLIALVDPPTHTTWFGTALTWGVGRTVIKKVSGIALHPFKDARTMIVATNGVLPLFCATKAGMSPLPDAGKPMPGVLFVHVMVAPVGLVVSAVSGIFVPAQSVRSAVGVMTGVGVTVIFCETVVVPHSFVTATVMV